MQLKTADHNYINVMQPLCIREDITIAPNDRQSVSMASQLYEGTTVTGILQPSNTLTDDGYNALCCSSHFYQWSGINLSAKLYRQSVNPQKRHASSQFDQIHKT